MTDAEVSVLKDTEASIESIRSKIDALQKDLKFQCDFRDEVLMEINAENMNSLKWLIQNPTMPGVYERIQKELKSVLKSCAITQCGYASDDNDKPQSFLFNFFFDDCIKEDTVNTDFQSFKEHILPHLFVWDKVEYNCAAYPVVGIMHRSESWGLYYVGYSPESNMWCAYETKYGRNTFDQWFAGENEMLKFVRKSAILDKDDE